MTTERKIELVHQQRELYSQLITLNNRREELKAYLDELSINRDEVKVHIVFLGNNSSSNQVQLRQARTYYRELNQEIAFYRIQLRNIGEDRREIFGWIRSITQSLVNMRPLVH